MAAIALPCAAGVAVLAVLTTSAASRPRPPVATPLPVTASPVAVAPAAAQVHHPFVTSPTVAAITGRQARPLAYKVVYIEDHTGTGWPVREATRVWDASTDLSVRYGQCRAHAVCVRVYEGWYGRTGHAADTILAPSGALRGATIRFNNSYRQNAHNRRQAACHEQGHALGLGHSPGEGSCMYYKETADASLYPSAQDKAMINALV
jgi:hypothetical protein